MLMRRGSMVELNNRPRADGGVVRLPRRHVWKEQVGRARVESPLKAPESRQPRREDKCRTKASKNAERASASGAPPIGRRPERPIGNGDWQILTSPGGDPCLPGSQSREDSRTAAQVSRRDMRRLEARHCREAEHPRRWSRRRPAAPRRRSSGPSHAQPQVLDHRLGNAVLLLVGDVRDRPGAVPS
jgi:hypothetical protein